MPVLKIIDAIKVADTAVYQSLDRDDHNPLVKDNDHNPYFITNKDFNHFSDIELNIKDKCDDFCIYESYFNTILFIEDASNKSQSVDINLIDDLVKSLNAIADDDYRVSTVNPAIVKLYAKNLSNAWAATVKEKAIAQPETQLGDATLKLAQQVQALNANDALLVQNFIQSLNPNQKGE